MGVLGIPSIPSHGITKVSSWYYILWNDNNNNTNQNTNNNNDDILLSLSIAISCYMLLYHPMHHRRNHPPGPWPDVARLEAFPSILQAPGGMKEMSLKPAWADTGATAATPAVGSVVKRMLQSCVTWLWASILDFVWQKLQYSNDGESWMCIFSGNRAGTFDDVTLDMK